MLVVNFLYWRRQLAHLLGIVHEHDIQNIIAFEENTAAAVCLRFSLQNEPDLASSDYCNRWTRHSQKTDNATIIIHKTRVSLRYL